MNILGFDTSGKWGIVFLATEESNGKDTFLAEETHDVGTHSSWLLTSIDKILKESNLSIHDIDLFITTLGPGSYTGLRIGMSALKGILFNVDKKIFGLSSLKAIALNVDKGLVSPVLDARKGEVYASLYKVEEGIIKEELIKESSYFPNDFIELLKGYEDVKFIGMGVNIIKEEALKKLKKASFVEENLNIPSAVNLYSLYKQGQFMECTIEELNARYLRTSPEFKQIK